MAGMRLGSTTESLELVQCREFMGPAGSRAPNAQPFHVNVHPLVRQEFDSAGRPGLAHLTSQEDATHPVPS